MTVQSSSLSAFSVAPGRGRSPKPLSIFGHDVFVKLANAGTDGAVAIIQHPAPPMGGPPLHRHSREDEWFCILRGEITFEIDGERIVLRAGGSAFAPRGTAHSFQNLQLERYYNCGFENSIYLRNQRDTIRLCHIVTWMNSGSTEFLRITGAVTTH